MAFSAAFLAAYSRMDIGLGALLPGLMPSRRTARSGVTCGAGCDCAGEIAVVTEGQTKRGGNTAGSSRRQSALSQRRGLNVASRQQPAKAGTTHRSAALECLGVRGANRCSAEQAP